jgi:polysaccharide pyruvyl transferase CsaB
MAKTVENAPPNIVICGNYGATNLGDEAILDGILKIIRSVKPDAHVTVLSSNPRETSTLHKVDSEFLIPAGIRSLFKGIASKTIGKTLNVIRDADLFILGGGGLFTDEKIMAVMIWALQAKMAYIYNIPVFCLGQSVGPLKTVFGRNITRKVFLNASRVTVRGSSSKEALAKLGVPNVIELADPAFMFPTPEPVQEKPENYVVFSVRPWIKGDNDKSYDNLAQFIDWLWTERGMKSVLVPFQIIKDNDLDPLNKILDRVKNKECAEIFEYTSNYHKVIELMAKSSGVIGMRLHSLIFASLAHTPFIGLSYSQKVREFARKMEMEYFVLDFEVFGVEDLKSRFDSLMNNRDEVVERLIGKVMVQRSKVLEHEGILKELLM